MYLKLGVDDVPTPGPNRFTFFENIFRSGLTLFSNNERKIIKLYKEKQKSWLSKKGNELRL